MGGKQLCCISKVAVLQARRLSSEGWPATLARSMPSENGVALLSSNVPYLRLQPVLILCLLPKHPHPPTVPVHTHIHTTM